MNERANQSGFSMLSVNGIKSCGSSVIVSFIKSYAYEFHKKSWMINEVRRLNGSCVHLEGGG